MRTGFGRPRIDYKTEEELRVTVDLDAFVKENVDAAQWEELQKEAEALRVYFSEVKDRKREEVRQMAGLDRASKNATAGVSSSLSESTSSATEERERVAKELRGMGMHQEDVDELEMINWDDDVTRDAFEEGEEGVKVPKVPVVDTLKGPFVKMMDRVLFQTARE